MNQLIIKYNKIKAAIAEEGILLKTEKAQFFAAFCHWKRFLKNKRAAAAAPGTADLK